ncbi:hypothetical protein DQ04_02391010 [Trypanosoma grayi]|uniref:hypothetical protein n=1 Tax=Trypanosoma grayi TaxID=71804 RepID=UPI0004F4B763|nr:hypothetical protein DQ04_02391010 [Trypanosoma grayi]KEG11655.1 hypothetical protein DQ04_02391010 [Trypanosoma grayi]
MNDEETKVLASILRHGDTLLVQGHSGHRLRLYYDALPHIAAKAGVSRCRVPVPLLVSSLGRLFRQLKHLDASSSCVFFVNTDLCSAAAVREALLHHGVKRRLRTLTLWKLHHSHQKTLKLLRALEQGDRAAAKMVGFRYSFPGEIQYPLIIPEWYAMSESASRLSNSADAALTAGVADIRSYYSKWLPAANGRLWTDMYIFERMLPPDLCGNLLEPLRTAVEAVAQREVTVIDVCDAREGVERAALCFSFLSDEICVMRRILSDIVKCVKAIGWALIAQTGTSASFDMPNRVIHLWRGSRVAFNDGRSGIVCGFEEVLSPCGYQGVEWPVVRVDGENDAKLVLPSVAFLHRMRNMRVSELPLRYGDTTTAEELFLATQASFTGRRWTLRPSHFVGHLGRLRCALASVPDISQVVLTSPVPWEAIMSVEGR